VTDQLREKHELAQRGIYKPCFLGGDMTVEDPKIRTPDAAFQAGRLMSRHEIYASFGVPRSMCDVQASYSIGSASDYFMLIFETCIPTGVMVCKAVSEVEQRRTGVICQASLNWNEHPVLQAVRRERADTAQKYFQMGVPLQVLNEYLDLEMPPSAGWDKGYLPATLMPVEEAGEVPAAGPEGKPEDYDDTVELGGKAESRKQKAEKAVSRLREELGPVGRLKRILSREKAQRAQKFDPDQPRDEDGKWGSGDGVKWEKEEGDKFSVKGVTVKKETAKAWLVGHPDGEDSWIPKSQCTIEGDKLTVPGWLKDQKLGATHLTPNKEMYSIEGETEKAWRLKVEVEAKLSSQQHAVTVFLPKSQMTKTSDGGLKIPKWLASAKDAEAGGLAW
jgi:hypothetical protein